MNNYMSRLAKPLAALFLAGCVVSSAMAQGAKVGVVNVERILRESNIAKSISSKIEADFSKRDSELKAKIAKFKGDVEKFEREAPTLPEAQRIAKQRELADKERELQRDQRAFQEDLTLRKGEGTQQIYEKATQVLKRFAEAEKFDLIVQEAAFVNPKLDVTDKVIEAMNASK